MKSAAFRLVCRFLAVAMMLLPFQTIHAGMIGTDRMVAAAGAQADRATVLGLIERSDVTSQLKALGLDPKVAADRVAAMTDEEVRSLAGKLDALPAGAASGWVWAAVIIVAVLLFYNWKR
jgi:hypothetical protein